MTRPAIYVAGAYNAPTLAGIAKNIARAEAVSLDVIQSGGAPVCPHTMARHWFGVVDEANALEWGLTLLRRCDAVVVVPHSEGSAGTAAEVAEAHRLGIRVVRAEGKERVVALHGAGRMALWIKSLEARR